MSTPTGGGPARMPLTPLAEYGRTVAVMAVLTAGCLAVRPHLTTVDVAMLLLVGVVLAASRYRRGPALLASVLSIAAFDFLFVPPYYTFGVHDAAYLLTFVVMLVVALTMSRLTGMIREHAIEAERRERRASAVAALNADLAGAASRDEVLSILSQHAGQEIDGQACAMTAEQFDGDPASWGAVAVELLAKVPESVAARLVREAGAAAGPGTGRCEDADTLILPLEAAGRHLGIAAVRPAPDGRVLEPWEIELLQALAATAGFALERTALAELHQEARADAQAERLRTSLLSSLSHDFRTPLATIQGAASSLLEEDGALTSDGRHDLADIILGESERMTRMVSNLLNMVRVEAGALAVQKSWQPLEEALGVALLRLDDRLRDHRVTVQLPPDLPLVPIDELLIEQVFINLLENAAKYTPAGTPVTVTATETGGEVRVTVADRGPGIPAGSEELIFKKFYRAPEPQGGSAAGVLSASGVGLGLAISRGIVTAHGGRMWAERGECGGAAISFTLPLSGPPIPALPGERTATASNG